MIHLGQIDQIAGGHRELGGQTRALGAHRILDHLHQHRLPLMEHLGDIHRLALTVAVLIADDIRGVQEGGPIQTDIDKGRLHTGQHPIDLALVDVTDHATLAGTLDQHLLQYTILHHRHPRLTRGDINEDLLIGHHNAAPWGFFCLFAPYDTAERQRISGHDGGILARVSALELPRPFQLGADLRGAVIGEHPIEYRLAVAIHQQHIARGMGIALDNRPQAACLHGL